MGAKNAHEYGERARQDIDMQRNGKKSSRAREESSMTTMITRTDEVGMYDSILLSYGTWSIRQ